jgi:type III pantothenate kinase
VGRPILLTVDIGNTNICFGPFEGENLRGFWRVSTDRNRTSDEYRPLLRELLADADMSTSSIRMAVISSVVPPVLKEIRQALAFWEIPALALTVEMDLGVRVDYRPPTSVGADRLANAIAVRERYGCPAIIVDVGTATTLDAVDADGVYVGGAIAPGLDAGMEGLFEQTYQLPRVQLEAPPSAIGKTTVESIRSGTVLGWAGLIDGLIDRFQLELGGEAVVVATGGVAAVVAPHTRHLRIVNEELTMEGLRLAYERMKAADSLPRDHGPIDALP